MSEDKKGLSKQEFLNYINELQKKRHTILPNSVTVQLIDKNGLSIKKENILCHLKVFIDDLSYHNYSFIPTDSEGSIYLCKADIIENTELKNYYDGNLPLESTPIKFEFSIVEMSVLNHIISVMENYLAYDEKKYRQDLINRGFNELQVESEIPKILTKMNKDQLLLSHLKSNNNHTLNYSQESSISGIWTKESDFKYQLTVK